MFFYKILSPTKYSYRKILIFFKPLGKTSKVIKTNSNLDPQHKSALYI